MSAEPPVPVVQIFDTTLRDGEQAPGCTLQPESKIAVARQLARLGVDIIEAGFPAASDAEWRAIKTIATSFGSKGPTVCGMARAIESDVDRAAQALRPAARPRIHTFLATSDIHLEHKLRMTRAAALERVASIVRYARNQVSEIQFSPEDATRSDRDFMFAVLDCAVESGATILNIPDTVGYATPDEYGNLIDAVVSRYASAGVTVSVHCHDDLGLAVANTIAGIAAGARQAECTINGIGERAGNAALEEVVMALRTRQDRLRLDTRIEARELVRASRLVERRTRIQVPPNKAVVGRNAFAHQSGIHQAGVLRHRATYEIMTRESVGFDRESIVLGKHSGRHALRARLERLGVVLDDETLDQVFPRFKAVADTKRTVSDRDLRDLLAAANLESADEVAAHAG